MKWEKLAVYLDVICVFGKDFDQKRNNLRELSVDYEQPVWN